MSRTPEYSSRQALTLLELVVVLFVLIALAGIIVPMVGSVPSEARTTATRTTLVAVREAVIRYWQDAPTRLPRRDDDDTTGRAADPQVLFLFVNPSTWDIPSAGYEATLSFDPNHKVGWRGPYLFQSTGWYPEPDVDGSMATGTNFTRNYGEHGDVAVLDAWGNPVVVQNPSVLGDGVQDVRVVSAGPNGKVEIDPSMSTLILESNLQSNPKFAGDDVWIAFQLR